MLSLISQQMETIRIVYCIIFTQILFQIRKSHIFFHLEQQSSMSMLWITTHILFSSIKSSLVECLYGQRRYIQCCCAISLYFAQCLCIIIDCPNVWANNVGSSNNHISRGITLIQIPWYVMIREIIQIHSYVICIVMVVWRKYQNHVDSCYMGIGSCHYD